MRTASSVCETYRRDMITNVGRHSHCSFSKWRAGGVVPFIRNSFKTSCIGEHGMIQSAIIRASATARAAITCTRYRLIKFNSKLGLLSICVSPGPATRSVATISWPAPSGLRGPAATLLCLLPSRQHNTRKRRRVLQRRTRTSQRCVGSHALNTSKRRALHMMLSRP